MGITVEPNDEYTRYSYRWQKVLDVLDGEDKLKQVDLARIGRSVNSSFTVDQVSSSNKYLRLLNLSDTSPYNKDRNEGYINGAVLFTATERTLSGLMGMLFRSKPIQPELPQAIQYILDNVDGSGNSIDQQAQSVGDSVTSIGRS
jgi:hypothetical protein